LGYTYGGTAEWYQDWWTARAGVFDLSLVPNSDKLSPGFAQGQFVAELEERHEVWDQPGKLKFLYWPTHGNLGTCLDAIALGSATGQTPSTGGRVVGVSARDRTISVPRASNSGLLETSAPVN
jgi:high affinity Mn2+ porin